MKSYPKKKSKFKN